MTSTFTPSGMVLADQPPHSAVATHFADAMADAAFNRLLIRAFELFCIVSVQPHAFTIDRDGILYRVSTDRAARTLTRARQHNPSNDSKIQTQNSNNHIFKHLRQMRTNTIDNTDRRNTVQRIVHHVDS